MSNNFHYAAYSYLDGWLQKDREFHDALAYENRHDTTADEGRLCLVEVAKYYGVIRTLGQQEDESRLNAAYSHLLATEPPHDGDVVEQVEALAKVLGGRPLSPLRQSFYG